MPDSVESGDQRGEKRLDLAFGDKALRYICESQVKARKELGEEAAVLLHARLADLEAVDAVTELTWAPVTLGAEEVKIHFHDDYCLIARANLAKPPLAEGGVDWNKVERLLLKRLERA